MSSEIINTDIKKIKTVLKESSLKKDLSDEEAFEYLVLQYFCYKTTDIETKLSDISVAITNGTDDGGIDFVYYDEDEEKVILGQCKYTENMQLNDVIAELNKMSTTVENFKKSNTGAYNSNVKKQLQNALDRLPDNNSGNIEYCIYTISSFNEKALDNKLQSEQNTYSKDMVSVYGVNDINDQIKDMIGKVKTVSEFKLSLDKPKNVLVYETDSITGYMVNISSESLIKMYNKFKDDGLFDLNIRKYIRNKNVDEGIKHTLDKERQNFWFYNNGLTIACSDCEVDGDKVKLYDFSIVNGGQTTNRIGNYKGDNTEKFYIPCKIIKIERENQKLYSKIAEATNSQKPINARDLKSNSPEMKMLHNWLAKENIYLEIKRGEKAKRNQKSIKNDELGQLILSFAYQQPGTARSGKKNIFENASLYNKIYRVNYEKDLIKKEFILDLITLNENYSEIEAKIKNSSEFNENEKILLSNGKFIIMALLGLSYMIINEDVDWDLISSDVSIIKEPNFNYGRFISNYRNDDYMDKLENLVKLILYSLDATYDNCSRRNEITSVSNLFKTDKKYRETIVYDFMHSIGLKITKTEFLDASVILKR